MQVLPTGDFQVDPSEDITFTVTRKDVPCKPGFKSNGWQSCGAVQKTDQNTRVLVCTAKATSGAKSDCTITVDFRNDADGSFNPDDEYTVQIEGSSGGSFSNTFDPPPVDNGQTFEFTVK